MKIYGYIENGQLQCTYLEPYTENVKLSDGRVIARVVSENEQAAKLDPIWKPMDEVNENVIASAKAYEVIVPTPYDAGDHIGFHYERMKDEQGIRREITELKSALSASDYKVTKCYEATLLGLPQPYDMTALHKEREAQRAKINQLEGLL